MGGEGDCCRGCTAGGLGDIESGWGSRRSSRGESVIEGVPSVGIVGIIPGRESTLSAGIEAKWILLKKGDLDGTGGGTSSSSFSGSGLGSG